MASGPKTSNRPLSSRGRVSPSGVDDSQPLRAENNSWNHYQDNKVEWLFDDPGRANLSAYARAGVIAFLFGRGGDGSTCACDAAGDGVTNPAPINGNARDSLSADDDGGYFRERAAAYYAASPMPLP